MVNTLSFTSISLVHMLVNSIKNIVPGCTVVGLRKTIQHILDVVSKSSFCLLLLSPIDNEVITDLPQ